MTLGVAVVGLGVGEAHARAYARHPATRVVWLYDMDAARSEEVARSVGQGRVASDYEQIIEDPDVAVVSIASYDDAHHAQTVAALRAHKHVFVEKPICRSVGELRDVAAAWRETGGRHLGSNHVLRAAPLYVWLRDALRRGELGRPYAVDGDYLYGRLEKITHGWRSRVPDYSVMAGGGIHIVDMVMWLTGERPDAVEAVGTRIVSEGTAFRYDDYTAAHLVFPSGLVSRVTANFGSVHRHQHVLRVFGTDGTFLYDDAGARLHRSRAADAAPERVDLAPVASDKGALIGPFVDDILSGADTRAHTQGILDAMTVCLAIDEAKERGGRIPVSYL